MCSESQFPAVPILWSGWRRLEEKDVTPDHVKTKIHSLTSDQAKLLETVLGDFVWITVGFLRWCGVMQMILLRLNYTENIMGCYYEKIANQFIWKLCCTNELWYFSIIKYFFYFCERKKSQRNRIIFKYLL